MAQDNDSLQNQSSAGIAVTLKSLPIPVQITTNKPVSSIFTKWVSHIAPVYIQDITFHDGYLWAATLGGVVKHSLEKEFSRTWFGSEHNLPGSAFRCMAIDGLGYVWVGGHETSLAWWDGQRWNNTVSGLAEKQDIYCFFVDSDGVLWCCCEQGLGTVKISAGCATWSPYHLKNLHLPFKEINAFVFDSKKGSMYFGSDRGLFFKKIDTENWNRLTVKDRLQDYKVTKLLWLNDNYLYVGTLHGLSIFDNEKIRSIEDIQECVNGLAYESDSDAVWISTTKNIYKLNKDKILRFSQPFFKDNRMAASITATSNKVWVGFDKGIAHFQPIPTDIQAPRGHDFPVGSILSIFVEENHDVWVGANTGLWRYKSGVWMQMKQGIELASEISNVTHIAADSSNHVWISSGQSGKSGGLRMLKSGVEITYKKNNTPASSDTMSVDVHGNLWIAKNDQIYKFDNEQWSFFSTLPNQVELAQSIYVDEKSDIWLGSNTGLWRYQNKKWNNLLPNQDVHSIVQSEGDALLIGAFAGIYFLKSNNLKEIKLDLPNAKILCLCCVKNGDLYIGTTEGLVRYREGNTEIWDIWNSGLAGQVVRTIVEDNNRLWVGTNSGLSQFTVDKN